MRFAFLLVLLALPAFAVETYEDRQVQAAATEAGLRLAPAPKDARIEFIHVVRSDVFTQDDPFPSWFNWFHWLSVDEVVRRELLVEVGDRFSVQLEESARNLRRIGVFSAVQVVPVVDAEGRHGVLVFTRDLWSLRAEQAFQVTGATLDRLLLQITERNLLGRHLNGSIRFQVAPRIFALGQIYRDRRVLGSSFSLFEQGDLVFSQDTGQLEGVVGSAVLGWPIYDFKTPWGADLVLNGQARPLRQIQGSSVLVYDAPDTPEIERFDREWDERQLDVQVRVRRQFGERFKHRLALGLSASFQDRTPRLVDVDPLAKAAFERDVIPLARDQVFPFLAYQGFTPVFRRFANLDTFAREEPVRVGPAIAATLGAGSRGLLSSSDFVFLTAGAAIVQTYMGDGLGEIGLEMAARLEDGEVIDRVLQTNMRIASPTTPFGRLTLRFDTSLRAEDSQNTLVSIGGDNGLRGTPSQAFFVFGGSSFRGTAEWRTPPLVVQTIHVGFIGFYDVGDVWNELDELSPKHSIGIGARLLFPQFNLTPYRIDLGVPLDGSGFNLLLSFGSDPVVFHGLSSVDRLVPTP